MRRLESSALLIRAASLLVPFRQRREWREEWDAEIRHARETLRERGDSHVHVGAQLRKFAWGSVEDAAWHRVRQCNNRQELTRGLLHWAQSPGFCLGAIVAAILLLAVISGALPMTRSILFPLPYREPDRLALITQGGSPISSTRMGIHLEWVRLWQSKSKLLAGLASYRWKDAGIIDAYGHSSQAQNIQVSDYFFTLLGVRAAAGRTFLAGDAVSCADCVVVSHDFWNRRRRPGDDAHILLDGNRYRVIGVLDRRFWFLSRRSTVWSLAPPAPRNAKTGDRAGVIVRLREDVSTKVAEKELEAILQANSVEDWESLVQLTALSSRVRSVLASFGLALALATIIVIATLRVNWPRFTLFFTFKTALLLTAILLTGLEFTGAGSITMLGGTDLSTEPVSTWLFMMACMGALTWSVFDQRRRCRVCLRRLGLATQVGCPGCLLLNWAGTELVCIEGHGMLHVPEMAACWQDSEKWTTLDDSWQGLFDRVPSSWS